jgi:hypothetical protein
VNAIPAQSCLPGIDEDQRGVARPQGDGCGIGSVELAEASPPTGGGNQGEGDGHGGNGPTGSHPDGGGSGAHTGGKPSSGPAPAPESTEKPAVTPKFTG